MSDKMDSLALPEVAIIRKGDAKVKKTKADGSVYETVGPDLKDRFRVVFAPGAVEYQKIFEAHYHTLKPERIRAMVLSPSVWDSWSWANEAYTAGRMVAKADDTHYLMKRDPLTGAYQVTDGEPWLAFEPGQSIVYQKGDKKIELKLRTVGRLRLFLPEMERLVQLTLKTTSYYDRLNIDGQLASIQSMANTLNHGNAAGIPLHIFRMEQEIVWNKPDGSAQRVKKWLINIEADSEWVRAAVGRLSRFALTGEQITGLLQPPTPPAQTVMGKVEPEQEEVDENPTAAEVLEGEAVEPEPAQEPPEPAPKKKAKNSPAARPYLPAPLKEHLADLARQYALKGNTTLPENIKQVLAINLQECFAPADDATYKRRVLTWWLFGKEHLAELQPAQLLTLRSWLNPSQDSGGAWSVDEISVREAQSAYKEAEIAKGQMVMPI